MLVFGFALVQPPSLVMADDTTARPNIVVIMVDDLDSESLHTALNLQSSTFPDGLMPHLKHFVVEPGAEFTESFATFPLCCPSRATYLTGLYPHNHDVLSNKPPAGGFPKFDDSSTVATWLQDAGYRTGHVGKYLNGYSDASYVPPGWSEWHSLVGGSTYCMYNFTISNDGVPKPYPRSEQNYQTDVLADYMEQFIDNVPSNGSGQPFFLSITPLAPHLETQCNSGGIRPAPRHRGSVDLALPIVPSTNEEDMSDKPAWMRDLEKQDLTEMNRVYNERLTALRAVDDLVGRLEVVLARHGALDNTVVIFTSDNGYLLGQHRWHSKVVLYEESIRVPLYIRLPKTNAAGTVQGIALNNDLAPTIAAIAGVTPELAVDGRSLLPLLRSSSAPWRKRFLVEHPPGDETMPIPPYFAARETNAADHTSLIYAETLSTDGATVTDQELYDLAIDAWQLDSLHADDSPLRSAQRAKLHQYIEALKTCGNGTCQAIEDRSGQ